MLLSNIGIRRTSKTVQVTVQHVSEDDDLILKLELEYPETSPL